VLFRDTYVRLGWEVLLYLSGVLVVSPEGCLGGLQLLSLFAFFPASHIPWNNPYVPSVAERVCTVTS